MFLIQTIVGLISGIMVLNLWLFLTLKWVETYDGITNTWSSMLIVVTLLLAGYMLAIYATDNYKAMCIRIIKFFAPPVIGLLMTFAIQAVF